MSSSLTGESSWDSTAERGCNELAHELHGAGVPLMRISKTYKLKNVLLTFSTMGDGLQYQPASDKHSSLLFTNVCAIRSLPPTDGIYRKAHLKHFQYCFQVETKFGWSWFLVCSTEMERGAWIEFLEQQRRSVLAESRTSVADACVTRYWTASAMHGKTKLSFNEVSALFKSLFGHIPPDAFAEQYRLIDSDNDTYLTFEEFRTLFSFFNEVDLVRQLYERETADREQGMSATEFTRFCTSNDDASNASPMRCASLFQLFTNHQTDRLHLPVFTAFLLHPQHNSIVDRRQLRVVDSMDYPLNHYFISSSHNTYLCGNQLNSESSCRMYRDVLQAGCRCVEIDCWDGPDGQPIVYHGHTMTTKIGFEAVIRTINAHAFQDADADPSSTWNPREFPVTLSLEVHTNTEQTNRMAEIMRAIFKERLFVSNLFPASYTPNKLKGMILVKWRMNAAGVEEVKDTTGSGIRPDRRAPTRSGISALSACASIGSVKTTTWGASEQSFHVESFTETEAARLGNTAAVDFTRQNSRMLARTYPAGTRIDSSNYDPMPMWRLGCQMVALNWQTRDSYLRLNEGFFAHRNGGCGYVLKPMCLRDVGKEVKMTPFKLSLRVICGSHLHTTFNGVDAAHVSVRVWMHGDVTSYETAIVPAAMYPQWNETVELRGDAQELDVLCLRVVARTAGGSTHDVCTACLPVCVLRTGFHAVPLRHAKGGHAAAIASVFCHLGKEAGQSRNDSRASSSAEFKLTAIPAMPAGRRHL